MAKAINVSRAFALSWLAGFANGTEGYLPHGAATVPTDTAEATHRNGVLDVDGGDYRAPKGFRAHVKAILASGDVARIMPMIESVVKGTSLLAASGFTSSKGAKGTAPLSGALASLLAKIEAKGDKPVKPVAPAPVAPAPVAPAK